MASSYENVGKLFTDIFFPCMIQVRLCGDAKQSPQFAIVPFGGDFVDAVAFLSSPRGTDGHVLLTGVLRNTKLLNIISMIEFRGVKDQSTAKSIYLLITSSSGHVVLFSFVCLTHRDLMFDVYLTQDFYAACVAVFSKFFIQELNTSVELLNIFLDLQYTSC